MSKFVWYWVPLTRARLELAVGICLLFCAMFRVKDCRCNFHFCAEVWRCIPRCAGFGIMNRKRDFLNFAEFFLSCPDRFNLLNYYTCNVSSEKENDEAQQSRP